mmetsp:Transcript_75507/g.209804  ORF Transcript_75507/g.209804 Transcript_75507/m.209804 type:complete len:328 (-) Transcript_75507:2429-3412(-)
MPAASCCIERHGSLVYGVSGISGVFSPLRSWDTPKSIPGNSLGTAVPIISMPTPIMPPPKSWLGINVGMRMPSMTGMAPPCHCSLSPAQKPAMFEGPICASGGCSHLHVMPRGHHPVCIHSQHVSHLSNASVGPATGISTGDTPGITTPIPGTWVPCSSKSWGSWPRHPGPERQSTSRRICSPGESSPPLLTSSEPLPLPFAMPSVAFPPNVPASLDELKAAPGLGLARELKSGIAPGTNIASLPWRGARSGVRPITGASTHGAFKESASISRCRECSVCPACGGAAAAAASILARSCSILARSCSRSSWSCKNFCLISSSLLIFCC